MGKGKTQTYYDANPAANNVGLSNKHDITKKVRAMKIARKATNLNT